MGNADRICIALPSTGEEEWQAMRESVMSGWLTQGPKVAEFERQFAAMHGVRHAIAVTSCTTGLHLALAALDIGPGDEVIVPAFTWVATANVVLYCGATPVFVDVDPQTYNIDPKQIAAAVTERTKAIVPVHLFGLCADVEAVRAAVPEHVHVVEDAACAAGARDGDVYAGALGDVGVFSFHPRKSITTGEGGMITTNDDALADRMQKLRNHGAEISEEVRHHGPQPYLLPDFRMLGYNYRMTDLQGALGLAQLTKLESFIEERSRAAAFYHEALGDLDWIQLPEEPRIGRHAWQSFVTVVNPELAPKPRNALMQDLHAQGIDTRPGTHAVVALDYYQGRFDLRTEQFPGAMVCEQQSMAIPLHNRMSADDYARVTEALRANAS